MRGNVAREVGVSQLQSAMLHDAVNKQLSQRSSAEELQAKGILKGKPGEVSASVVQAMEALEASMLQDSLSKQLSQRPTLDELQEKGIVPCAQAA